MILYGDYHTHSKLSDGKNTLEENAQAAEDKHLNQIAVTEHSFGHFLGGIKRKQVPAIKERVKKLNEKHKLEILWGIEANLISPDGDLDITEEENKEFDIVIVGFHQLFIPKTFAGLFNFLIPNTFRIGRASKKRIEKNTQAFIRAIEKNDIDIVAHLNAGRCPVNCVEIAKVAQKHNVYIELNGKRLVFTDKEMLEMAKTGVKFIINSDAHRSRDIGLNNKAVALIERLQIPYEQIANLDKKPVFKRCNNEKGKEKKDVVCK